MIMTKKKSKKVQKFIELLTKKKMQKGSKVYEAIEEEEDGRRFEFLLSY